MTSIALAAFVATLTVSAVAPAAAVEWARGNGQSCDVACGNIRRNAVASSVHKNTPNAFFVCAGDHPNGQRPGYNLKPNWARGCWVGYGGKEVALPNYSCLCE